MNVGARRIPDPLLECYLVGSLDADARAEVEAALEESETDRARLVEMQAESAAFLEQHPPGPLVERFESSLLASRRESGDKYNILVLADDATVSLSLTRVLEGLGNNEIHLAHTLEEARRTLENVMIDIAFITPSGPPELQKREEFTLLQEIRGRYQTVPIVVSSHSQPNDVREAMRLGAEDYVLETEIDQRVPIIIKELRQKLRLKDELLDSGARGVPASNLGLIGTSVAIQSLRALIQKFAIANSQDPVPVLIQGPSGSGKELVAHTLHECGPHASEPFFDINCGAIPETLIEAQLFGYVRGAFTDATRDQDGYLALVRRGTLFLDDVAELSPAAQAMLLRVLETRRFRPVGPTAREQPFQGRIVCASRVDLMERVQQGLFREDLFHRLNVLSIRVPPLSEHREDIPALVQHFAARHRKPLQFTQQALELLCQRSWFGNVRELRNAIYRLAILADFELIDAEAIEQYLPESDQVSDAELPEILREMARKLLDLPLQDKVGAITKALVQEALQQAQGNNTNAGKRLGWHRRTFERYLRKS